MDIGVAGCLDRCIRRKQKLAGGEKKHLRKEAVNETTYQSQLGEKAVDTVAAGAAGRARVIRRTQEQRGAWADTVGQRRSEGKTNHNGTATKRAQFAAGCDGDKEGNTNRSQWGVGGESTNHSRAAAEKKRNSGEGSGIMADT